MNTPKKILVIRNDKIGDFMLAWPAFALLKKQYPKSEITALVPKYTAPLAEQCEWIDKVLIDTKKDSFFNDALLLSRNIKLNNYDLSISLFSELRTSLALWLACVKTRVGPATKIAQIFLNKTFKQKRSQSKKPEYEYNLDLIKYSVEISGDKPVKPVEPPFLTFGENEKFALRNELVLKSSIQNDTRIIFIHPGTGGSAINLSLKQYAELALNLSAHKNTYIVITAGPDELAIATELSRLLREIKHHIHHSTDGIINFCKIINLCDIFISGSTGPLHIAGALNVSTVAFYPARQSATALRWMTLNTESKRLAFTITDEPVNINIKAVAASIFNKYLD